MTLHLIIKKISMQKPFRRVHMVDAIKEHSGEDFFNSTIH